MTVIALAALALSLFIIAVVGIYEANRLDKENRTYQRELKRVRARRKTEFDMDLVPISGHLPNDTDGGKRSQQVESPAPTQPESR